MARYITSRFVWLLMAMFYISAITFGLGILAPGDPAEVLLERTQGQPPTLAQIDEQRRVLGLDSPYLTQYGRWLGRAVQGDLGRSWTRDQSVISILFERVGNTVVLAASATTLAVLIGLSVGTVAAGSRRRFIDGAARIGALVGSSVPSYFIGYLLILVFAVQLKVLPAFGSGSVAQLVLPAVTLSLSQAAILTRLTRAGVLEVLSQDHVRTARAKGLPAMAVLVRHCLRNALIPVVTVIGLGLGSLLGGAVIVETVFAWPGLGQLAVEAIRTRDFPLIQGVVLAVGVIYVVVNFAVDVSYVWLDPRIRLEAD